MEFVEFKVKLHFFELRILQTRNRVKVKTFVYSDMRNAVSIYKIFIVQILVLKALLKVQNIKISTDTVKYIEN